MTDPFNTPWSAADLAKAVRDTVAETRAAISLFQYLSERVDGQKARGAARHLASLGFVTDGMKRSLRKLATGDVSRAQIESLAEKFEETGDAVAGSIDKLRGYRYNFIQEHGLEAAFALYDEIIWGELGKLGIRNEIAKLLQLARAEPMDMVEIREMADVISSRILVFNANLAELHLLLGGKKAKFQANKRRTPKRVS